MNVNQIVIPDGCMKYIQAPAYVEMQLPFKTKANEIYDVWISSGI